MLAHICILSSTNSFNFLCVYNFIMHFYHCAFVNCVRGPHPRFRVENLNIHWKMRSCWIGAILLHCKHRPPTDSSKSCESVVSRVRQRASRQ